MSQDSQRRNSCRTSNVTQHFQVTMMCQTGHMMHINLKISFYFCLEIKKIRNLGKQNLLQVQKAYTKPGKENTAHGHHLLSGTQRKLLLTATLSYIRKSTNQFCCNKRNNLCMEGRLPARFFLPAAPCSRPMTFPREMHL